MSNKNVYNRKSTKNQLETSFSMANTTEIEPERIEITQQTTENQTDSCNECGTCDKCIKIKNKESELYLKYGSKSIIMLFVPVSVCMLIVIISLNVVTSYQSGGGAQLLYTPLNEDQSTDSKKFWTAIGNAAIFIGVVVVMTIFLLLLYKYRCYKVMHGWLCLSSLLLLFLMTYIYLSEFVHRLNIVIDYFTLAMILWNFGCIGMICIHWIGPLKLQQIYLILVCSQMALIFIKYLPDWTTWVVLAFISIWDLIAVLCPFGPLNILVKTAKERDEKLFPAMVYSSTIVYPLITMTNNNEKNSEDELISSSESNQNYGSNLRRQNIQVENDDNIVSTTNVEESREQKSEEAEEEGVKLGLGDFIFYSVLVGKASILGDWNTVIACFVAILIGLSLTILLLAIYHRALPALPFSLTFGLIFYFCTNLAVRPFYDELTIKQYFI